MQDAAAKPEFDKYVVTVNGKEAALKKVGTAYTLASLTQFDTLEIEAFVKNIDDTAVFEWTRGAGLAKIQIEGTTAKVTVDTSSTVMGQYMINATVTCGGASFKLPTIRVQKVNALKLATPEIIGQPVSASYGQGQSPKALQVMVKNDAGAGNLQCNWYSCDDQNRTNPVLVATDTKFNVAEDGKYSVYTPSTSQVGTTWFYGEIYRTRGTLEGTRVLTDCVKVEVTKVTMELEGQGTEQSPWLLKNQEDLNYLYKKVADGYSYSSDYDVIGKLKQFADKHGVCVLIVHHTRKQPAGDSFEMISGTTGLLGCADGALLMQKEKRTDGKATLDIVGRDQPDQRLYLTKDQEHLVWELERAENELWKQPPDPVLEAVSKMVSAENPDWEGSPTELAETLQTDMAVNRLTKHLNVNASRLLEEHHVKYENKTKHAGRRIRLTYMVVEQTAVAVTE